MNGPRSTPPPQVHLALLAKAPVAGRVKTRLCPPCSPAEAALLAQAAIEDTLAAMSATAEACPVVVLDGEPGSWLPAGMSVVAQRDGDLAHRLQGAIDDVGGPVVVIGMDTPQVTPSMLGGAVEALLTPDTDVVLGPAADGGYWAIGVKTPHDGLFADVTMSVQTTAREQRARLRSLGLRWVELGVLRDVDSIADAREVALEARGSRFAQVLRSFDLAGDPQA